METKDELEFELNKPFDFDYQGEKETAGLLVLRAPSNKQHKYRVRLQQGFFQAINAIRSTGNSEQAEQNVEVGGAEILALMLSSDVDMVEYHEVFQKLICSSVCMIEDKTPLTSVTYDKIHPDDLDRLMGEYLGNFILSSALATLGQK